MHRRQTGLLLLVVGLLFQALQPIPAAFAQTPTPAAPLHADLAKDIDPQKVAPAGPLRLEFDQPVDTGSASPALLLFPAVAGNETWDEAARMLTFTPADGFPPNQEFLLTLNPALTSRDGGPLEQPAQWRVLIAPAPRVLDHKPAEYDLGQRDPVFTIQFDRAMEFASLEKAIHFDPPAEFSLSWAGATATIRLKQPLEPAARLTLTLDRQARDRQGSALDQVYTWTYATIPFEITALECASTRITLDFSYPIDAAKTIQGASIEPAVAGTWQAVGGTRLVFTPAAKLNPAARYTLRFAGPMSDSRGSPLPDLEPAACTPPPPFAYFPVPQSDGTVVESARTIRIAFERLVDQDTVRGGFHLSPDVKGELTFDTKAGRDILFFTPAESFTAGQTYTVTLDAGARWADGTAMIPADFTWRFTYQNHFTERAAVFADSGPNIQVIDAEAPRVLQFSNHDVTGQLFFDFYAVDLPQFVDLYRQYFHISYYYGQSNPLIDLSALTQTYRASMDSAPGVEDFVLPADLPNGLYVLALRDGSSVLDQIFIVLSRSVVAAKVSGSRIFTWTTNTNSGSAGAVRMRVYTQTGELMREGDADEEGIFETSLPIDSAPLLVAAQDAGGDITLTGIDSAWGTRDNWYSDYGWYGWGSYAYPDDRLKIYTFTDRPIYRPGNTVHYKSILRADGDLVYSLPEADTPVSVRLRDARDNLLAEREQSLDEFGAVYGDFVLPPETGLGDYVIEISAGGVTAQQIFSVQEYAKPDYSVQIIGLKDAYTVGDVMEFDVEAKYFLGQPVANAKVSIKFFYWQHTFVVAGKTDSSGRYHYKAAADKNLVDWYFDAGYDWGSSLETARLRISVTVEDGSNQSVSANTAYTLYSAPAGLRVDPGGYFQTVGKSFPVTVKAATTAGESLADVEVELAVTKTYWDSALSSTVKTVISRLKAVTGSDGIAVIDVQLDEQANYRLVATARASASLKMSAAAYVTALKPGSALSFDQNERLILRAEKDEYRPYEKARLMIQSAFAGPALLTFERGSVIHSQPVTLTPPVTIVETDIIPQYAPNIFVTLNVWENRPYQPTPDNLTEAEQWGWIENRPNSILRTEILQLKVEQPRRPLTVTVTSDQNVYLPRQQAGFTVYVAAPSGPVRAQLAVGLVDEAIYSLKDEPWGPIFSAFYGPRRHTVRGYDSMAIVRDLLDLGGRGGGGGDVPPDFVRSEFPDTALWLPAVTTDSNGKATFTLDLPDTLTRWRLTVRAVTLDTQVGETTYTIRTEQPLSLRPALPEILTAGDESEFVFYAHNSAGQARDLTAEISAPGFELLGDAQVSATVPADGQAALRWRVRAAQPGAAEVTVRVTGADGTLDAVRLPVTVRPRAILGQDSYNGEFTRQLEVPLLVPALAAGDASVEITLSRSLAGPALLGLEYLTGYPYGCVEQTMSKALPNAVVALAVKRLGLEVSGLEDLPTQIDAGIKKLYAMQHSDGGWGWWSDDASDAYQTAWVVYGLALTRDAGYTVEPKVILRGANYLRGALDLSTTALDGYYSWGGAQPDLDPRLRAFMLYSLALAGQGDRPSTLALAADYPRLDAFSQAAMALALARLGEHDKAGEIAAWLEQTTVRSARQASWPGTTEDGEYRSKTMASTLRASALALEALQTIKPESDVIPDVVRYLLAERKGMNWGTTNETAFALVALTGQLDASLSAAEPRAYALYAGAEQIAAGEWPPDQLNLKLPIPAGNLVAGLNQLRLEVEGEETVYYDLTTRIYQDALGASAGGTLAVKRRFFDAKTKEELSQFTMGQLVQVVLNVTLPQPGSYLMVEDRLPGGLTALNESLNTSSRQVIRGWDYYMNGDTGTYYFMWDAYGYNQKEIRPGRVTFFITYASKDIRLIYYARVTQAGTFTALPAEVSAMYDPALWGRSETRTVTFINPAAE